ncbi:MAG: hypothetical protein OXC12_01275 [Spirochaetaceae bacterium]|nr:hypothetical protein [Spirochaetaceae bacterium]
MVVVLGHYRTRGVELAHGPVVAEYGTAVILANNPADPFDRILVAQAIMNGCSLVTPDPLIKAYPVSILW